MTNTLAAHTFFFLTPIVTTDAVSETTVSPTLPKFLRHALYFKSGNPRPLIFGLVEEEGK